MSDDEAHPGLRQSGREQNNGLDPDSYTAHRLQHATAHHLYLTSRRCFIGPIPQEWLKSNKSWYRSQLPFQSYSSRTATFSADSNVSNRRQTTGLDGPSAAAMYGHGFRQPDDVNDEEEEEGSEDGDTSVADTELNPTTDEPTSPDSQAVGEESIHPGLAQSENEDMREISPTPSLTSVTDTDLSADGKRKWQRKWKRRKQSKVSNQSKDVSSFVTAPGERVEIRQDDQNTEGSPTTNVEETETADPSGGEAVRYSTASSSNGGLCRPTEGLDSRTSLLLHGRATAENSSPPEITPKSLPSGSTMKSTEPKGSTPVKDQDTNPVNPSQSQKIKAASTGLVIFNLPDELGNGRDPTNINVHRRSSLKPFHRSKLEPGEVLKVDKMLVRVDFTVRQLSPDYDENDSQKIESRVVQKWREFVVVCRKSTEEDFEYVLQMYKSRVIPTMEDSRIAKRSEHMISLTRKSTKLNLFSSLDKTIVIWLPWRNGTKTYILRPQSSASSVEWYTFLRGALGYKRSGSLQVSVPDLNVTLELSNPFKELEKVSKARGAEKDDSIATKTMAIEKAIVGTIIKRCMEMLERSPEWSDVVKTWLKHEKMGLAWKRYDRLEWIHGANEQKMYGTLAMRRTHDLELRPKHHYPTVIINEKKEMEEPAPVEGFLVRLTSQKGRDQRFGRKYVKRLYFSTHNQYLCYCKPAKATPPAPPKLDTDQEDNVPKTGDLAERIPLIYAVNPYPIDKGRITWIRNCGPAQRQQHDQYAYEEAERKVNTLLKTEGHVNLCHVVRVQNVQIQDRPAEQPSSQEAENESGGEIEGIAEDAGTTGNDDLERSFELVLKNGLAIRLQAYDKITKKEWITRLRQIVKYWKIRTVHDMRLYKEVRQENLERLRIDEELESTLGQYAQKWEVSRSVASPQLFNMCGISCCRAITISGVLYRKPRKYSTFERCSVILCHGQLLMFQSSVRKATGKVVSHIHHERQQVLDLKDCYIYSGLITEDDLPYEDQTFDSSHPGHHALPRVYREDGWTSQDESAMTCFVIWHGKRKSFFMANAEGKARQKLRYVSRLGVSGRSIAFKTRSRAERDHWVMSIGMEIERLHQAEEVRFVQK